MLVKIRKLGGQQVGALACLFQQTGYRGNLLLFLFFFCGDGTCLVFEVGYGRAQSSQALSHFHQLQTMTFNAAGQVCKFGFHATEFGGRQRRQQPKDAAARPPNSVAWKPNLQTWPAALNVIVWSWWK